MATWADFEAQAADLATVVRERFTARRHATLATLRKDGSPRISGSEVEFGDGEMWIGSMPGAMKALDLRRDPRFALHSPTYEPPENSSDWLGEAKLSGRVVEVPSDDESHRFRLDITEAVFTRVDGDQLVIQSWHQGRGVETRTRQ